MPYDAIRERIDSMIPLNRTLGIEIAAVEDGRAVARLPFRPEVTNHLRLVHATAIFGVAEAASGCAIAGLFSAEATRLRSVTSAGSVNFVRPARSSLTAIAEVVSSPAALREHFDLSGRMDVDVSVVVNDESQLNIATALVKWNVSRRR